MAHQPVNMFRKIFSDHRVSLSCVQLSQGTYLETFFPVSRFLANGRGKNSESQTSSDMNMKSENEQFSHSSYCLVTSQIQDEKICEKVLNLLISWIVGRNESA